MIITVPGGGPPRSGVKRALMTLGAAISIERKLELSRIQDAARNMSATRYFDKIVLHGSSMWKTLWLWQSISSSMRGRRSSKLSSFALWYSFA